MNTTLTNQINVTLSDRSCHAADRLFSTRPNSVIQRARRTLNQSNLFRGRSQLICIGESNGRLLLEGRLPSFYLKQMLQTLLRDVEGVKEIDNQVAVHYPG